MGLGGGPEVWGGGGAIRKGTGSPGHVAALLGSSSVIVVRCSLPWNRRTAASSTTGGMWRGPGTPGTAPPRGEGSPAPGGAAAVPPPGGRGRAGELAATRQGVDLIGALADSDAGVAEMAAWAAGEQGAQAAVPALVRMSSARPAHAP